MEKIKNIKLPNGEVYELGGGLDDKITNCITEIPQRIKLELNNGVLTLKAGSVVIVPNGFEADGTTPKFDEVVVNNDYSQKSTYNANCLCFYNLNGNLANHGENISFSGNTQPTSGQVWYNTATNKILVSSDNGQTWVERRYTLPIARTTATTNGFTSIDQVFNGMGYIGSTVWVDKGVKGLIPNGRNEDGTLKNKEVVVNKLSTHTRTDTRTETYGTLSKEGVLDISSPLSSGLTYYDEQENIFHSNSTRKGEDFPVFVFACTNGVISNFQPKQPFRAVDYSDSLTVSGWAMPSNKYIDLPLGASNTEYTAPANGYYFISYMSINANFSYVTLDRFINNAYTEYGSVAAGGGGRSLLQPCLKGQKVRLRYDNINTNNGLFRFIYADGEV